MATVSDEPMEKKTNDFIKQFAEMMDAYPGAGLREVIRLIPDGLFVGTGIFSLMSQNYPVSMLFLTLFETLLITVGIQNLSGYLSLPTVLPKPEAISDKCVSGFQSPTLQTLSLFFKMPVKSSYPSPPVFVLTTACIYVLSCLQQFIPEMEGLGPSFSLRFYLSIILSFLALFIVILFRFLTGCETMGVLILSIFTGFVLGLTLSYQNMSLFGKEAINLMGIPTFVNTTADGKPIYVCPQKLVPT